MLHPFEDGNGRLARTLFYWYMLRKHYWAFSYLSLSEPIRKSPKQYAMAFIFSEQDDNDLNYFIHYNMQKLKMARTHFETYLAEKIQEHKAVTHAFQADHGLNRRQLKTLQYLAKGEQDFTSLSDYVIHHGNISKATATTDLKILVEKGLVRKIRNGRNITYHPTPKIREIF